MLESNRPERNTPPHPQDRAHRLRRAGASLLEIGHALGIAPVEVYWVIPTALRGPAKDWWRETRAVRAQVRTLHLRRLSPRRIARLVALPVSRVLPLLPPVPGAPPLSLHQKHLLRTWRQDGRRIDQIAAALGLLITAVYARLPPQLRPTQAPAVTPWLIGQMAALRSLRLSLSQVAFELGVSSTAVRLALCEPLPRRAEQMTPATVHQIRALRRAGRTLEAIAAETGYSGAAVRAALPARLRGAQKTAATLHRRMAQLRAQGWSCSRIAAAVGRSQSAVWMALYGKNRRWVAGKGYVPRE